MNSQNYLNPAKVYFSKVNVPGYCFLYTGHQYKNNQNNNFFVGVIYRAPSKAVSSFLNRGCSEFFGQSAVIIGRDFNLDTASSFRISLI